jgi:hypothetical protein
MRRISQAFVQLRMPHTLHQRIRDLATREASTPAATMRRLLAIAIAREEKAEHAQ